VTIDNEPPAPLKAVYQNVLDRMRLHMLAEDFGIDRQGDLGSGWAYDLALAMARKKFPGFSRPPKQAKKSGPALTKDARYKLGLSLAVAGQEAKSGKERGAAASVARGVAKEWVNKENEGSRSTAVEIKARTLQIANDLSALTPQERFAGLVISSLVGLGVTAEDIPNRLDALAKSGELDRWFAEYLISKSHKVPDKKPREL
jgi:hypothetical protein